MTRHRLAFDSPIGRVLLEGTADRLSAVTLGAPGVEARPEGTVPPVLREAARQLREYFEGRRTRFELPLALEGTPFQRAVWETLVAIPFGATWSYGELARALGRPGASRAVGGANGRNPLAIVVPCHRVIGADGRLTGYAGGPAAKRWLLAHEARVAGRAGQGTLL